MAAFKANVAVLAGAAGLGGLTAVMGSFIKNGFEAADAIGDAADRAGIAVESLSRLKYVAEQNDLEFSALTTGLKRFQVIVSQAASGSKEAQESIGLLGLSAEKLKGLKLEDQLKLVADQFARIKDPADQTRVAVELFTRSGEQFVPMLKQGGDAIGELTAKADKFGITLDQNTTQSVDRADKALKTLKATVISFGSRVAGNIALALVGPANELDAALIKLDELKRKRDELANAGAITKIFVPEEQRTRAIQKFNDQIDQQLRLINALNRAKQESPADKNPLTIAPKFDPLDEVHISAQKRNVEGLQKVLEDFNEQTRTSLEAASQQFESTRLKLQELFEQGKITATQLQQRLADATIAYNNAIDIEPVKVTVQKVTETLTGQKAAIHDFVDTVKEGLTNLAQSGEITGKSIVRYLLSALQSRVLYKAIESLGAALSEALTKSGGGGAGNFIGSVLGGVFGHAAGGGRMSGVRVVGEDGPELDLGGGNILNSRQLAFAVGGIGGGITYSPTTVMHVDGGSDPIQVAQYVEARIAQNNKRQLEQFTQALKRNGFGSVR